MYENNELIKIMEQSIQMYRACGEKYEMLMSETSKLLKARFDSLVSAGFSEPQALEIIKVRGIE